MPPKAPDLFKYVTLFDKAFDNEHYRDAIFYAKFALDLYYSDPDYYPTFKLAMFHHNLGNTFSMLDDEHSAISHYLKSLELDRTTSTLDDLATSYFQLKAYGQAIEVFGQAIELSPQNPYYYYRRARASAHANRMDLQVIADCKKAYELRNQNGSNPKSVEKTIIKILNHKSSKQLIDFIVNLPDIVQKTELLQECLDPSSMLGLYFASQSPTQIQRIATILHFLSGPEDPIEKLKMQDTRELKALGFFDNINYSEEMNLEKLLGDSIYKLK